MAVIDAKAGVANSPVASYVPTEESVEKGWFVAAWEEIKFLFTTREGLLGNYDYAWLLTPDIPPFNRKYKDRVKPFYGIDERIPLLLTILLGLQHSLAMMGGVVTPPLLIAGASGANLDAETISYLVSASLILSGVFSFFQIVRFKVFNTGFYIGTGMISVVGEAFAVVPIAQAYFSRQYENGHCSSVNGVKQPCPDAYGTFIGTVAVVMLFQVLISLIKPRTLMKIFPNLVTGMVLLCIGGGLVASGVKSWAGGSGPCMARPESGLFKLCPNIKAPEPRPWGDPSFIGLGFSVYATILLVELFGAPLIRSCSVAVGLLVGAIISAATGFIDSKNITAAPSGTFVWVKTFPLSVDGSLVLPLLACCITTLVSCLGDVIATAEVSGIDIVGNSGNLDTRVQGGLTADGIWSVLAALGTCTPLVCFAQNNGVIALTGCASRRAGYACCFFLLLAGIASKFGASIVALPPSVIGGMTTFLFTTIVVSGLRILSTVTWNRRNRFIITAALTLGLADLIVPDWLLHLLPTGKGGSLQGFYDGVSVVIKTAYCLVAIVGVLLNWIVPEENVGDGGFLGGGETGDRGGAVAGSEPGRKVD
ncbi:Xanthine/uracil permease [Tuber magnatum]|uniref:Xanthine/uracil permease n=1 Tax=Tuber magnatum TaxID=42249 RepID=A0A317T2Q3_9PEZI|nr:Xanthine/uracil permease [Tuber magnatum]